MRQIASASGKGLRKYYGKNLIWTIYNIFQNYTFDFQYMICSFCWILDKCFPYYIQTTDCWHSNHYLHTLRCYTLKVLKLQMDIIILKFWIFCKCSKCLLTLSHLQTHFDAIAADDFWKHCGQRWNCSSWAISPLATMSSTLFNN